MTVLRTELLPIINNQNRSGEVPKAPLCPLSVLGAGHGSGVVVDVIQDVPKSLRYAVQHWPIMEGPMPPMHTNPFKFEKHCELVHPVPQTTSL